MGEIRITNASAGTGKTRALSVHYLNLLKGMSPCRENLAKILAITFTNKAAFEMKDRIINYLKNIAFQTDFAKKNLGDINFDHNLAEKWVDTIVKHYSDFQVRTIDSFLFSIFKSLSFELKLNSEIEVTFNIESEIEKAFDILLSKLEEKREIIEQMLFTFFELYEYETKANIYPETRLKKIIKDIYKKAKSEIPNLVVYEEDIDKLKEEEKRLIEEAKEVLNEDKNHNLIKIYEKINKNLVNREKKELLELRKKIENLLEAKLIIQLSGFVPVLKEIKDILDELLRNEGIVKGGDDWTDILASTITDDDIPLIYAYLGSKIEHLLFDEFQDTSRKQWEALKPIVINALAEGGSLFVVGDKKQAIYGWRGGDVEIFDEVEEFEKIAKKEKIYLNVNYRSHKKLIDFFNECFCKLEDKIFLNNNISNIFKEEDPDLREELSKKIKAIYEESKLKHIRDVDGDIDDFIKIIHIKEEEDSDTTFEILKNKVVEIIKKEIELGTDLGDIAILLRSNNEITEILTTLLENNIPAISAKSLGIERSKVVKYILNLMRLSYDPLNKIAEYGVISSKLINEPIDNLIKKIRRKMINSNSPYEFIITLIEVTDLKEKLNKELEHERPFVENLLEMAHKYETKEGLSIRGFIRYIESDDYKIRLGMPERINAVTVSTIHMAKGLEYPVVIVPYTSWRIGKDVPIIVNKNHLIRLGDKRSLPTHLRRKKFEITSKEFIETINLFYVALTRAKEKLYLLLVEKKRNKEKNIIINLLNNYINDHAKAEK